MNKLVHGIPKGIVEDLIRAYAPSKKLDSMGGVEICGIIRAAEAGVAIAYDLRKDDRSLDLDKAKILLAAREVNRGNISYSLLGGSKVGSLN